MFHPFFETSSLSDQELQDKINEVSMRISAARSAGIQFEIIQSMFTVIQACEEELRTRYSKKSLEETEKEDSCVFDTDILLDNKGGKKNESSRKSIYKRAW